ncbi:MAG: YbaB/EbfC family nucleoid-associated protein [Alphaproteobacteria bacterium]|nr:YbaB/EbfC family nucleoid-associated protein [Alphaproteobacteria bacterium]
MKNLGNLMKQAQEMQARMAELQEKLAAMEVEGSAGAGMVRVTMGGKGDLRRVKVEPSLLKPDEAEVVEDLIVAAAADARAKAERAAAEEMSKLTGGLQLPPGLKLPF